MLSQVICGRLNIPQEPAPNGIAMIGRQAELYQNKKIFQFWLFYPLIFQSQWFLLNVKQADFFIKTPVLTFFIHPLIFPNRRANVKPWPLCGNSGQLVQINAQFYSYKLMHNLHIGIPQVNAHCYSCKCISAGLGLTSWLCEANVCQMDMWPIIWDIWDIWICGLLIIWDTALKEIYSVLEISNSLSKVYFFGILASMEHLGRQWAWSWKACASSEILYIALLLI